MVTMRSVALTLPTVTEQERFSSPLMCTEQAPHCATPQPYLVPVSPTCSRITHSRGVSSSTCTSWTLPLMLSFAMRVPPAIHARRSARAQNYSSLHCAVWRVAAQCRPASLVDKSLAHSAAACTPSTLSSTISDGRCHGTTIAVKIAARCHAPQTETALASESFHLKNLHAGMRRGDRPRPPRSASLTLGIGAVAFMAAAPAAPGWCAQ